MENVLKYAGIEGASVVDGPGVRTVIWLQGCSIRCSNCQNQKLWSKFDGKGGNTLRLAGQMARVNRDVAGDTRLFTITGGEPFDQPQQLLGMLVWLKNFYSDAHIIVYTGYTWERLTGRTFSGWRERRMVLEFIDILVDGPYKWEQDNDHMQYVGSANQRVINVVETIKGKLSLLWTIGPGDLVLEDWSSKGLFTVVDGAISAASGWIDDAGLAGAGTLNSSPRCGEAGREEGE